MYIHLQKNQKRSNMKNYKTTICGIVAAIGTYLQTQSGTLQVVGQILSAVSLFLLGASAKDHNVIGR